MKEALKTPRPDSVIPRLEVPFNTDWPEVPMTEDLLLELSRSVFANNHLAFLGLGPRNTVSFLARIAAHPGVAIFPKNYSIENAELARAYVHYVHEMSNYFYNEHRWEMSLFAFLYICGFRKRDIYKELRLFTQNVPKGLERRLVKKAFNKAALAYRMPPVFAKK
jgi:hypothetical protein